MTTDTLAKLAACPFCGAAARVESNRDWHKLRADHEDGCFFDGDDEMMMVPATDECLSAMARDWNRRALTAQVMTPNQVRDGIADFIEVNTPHREFWTPEVVELVRSIEIKPKHHAALTAQAPAAAEPVTSGDWSEPTTHLKRFGDAMQLLCNGRRPPDSMLLAWQDKDADSIDLQEFAIAHGPAWAQGIGVIDAALVLVEQPTEGVDHEMAAQQAAQAPAGWQPIEAAEEGLLYVVAWVDPEDGLERHDFDALEDGIWRQHADNVEHFQMCAPPGSRGPKERPPYTHCLKLGALPQPQEDDHA